MIQVQQRLFGIGAQLRDDLNGFTITQLLEGGPAICDNKLRIGDKIIAVNGSPVVGMDILDAVELIRGPKGTKVLLTILRPSSENKNQEDRLDIEMTRGEIVIKENRLDASFEPYADGVIAHVSLFSFYQDNSSSSAEDLRFEIKKIMNKKS